MRRFDVAPVDTSADADTADQYAGESQPPRRRQRDSRHCRSRVAWRRHCGGRTGAGAATTAPAIVATIEVALCLRRRSWPLQWWRCLLLSRPARCRRRAAEAALRTQCGVSADPLSQEMARVPAAPPGEVPAACCEGSAADPLPSKFVS